VWGELGPGAERELLERAVGAFSALGLSAHGFRPPGGEITDRTPALLRELGFQWCSPAGDGPPAACDGLVLIPFDWELVDAYHLMERFADLRERRGDGRGAIDAEAAAERMWAAIRGGTGVRMVIMHPFLILNASWRGQVQRLLEQMAALGGVVSGGEFARSRVGS
jgi:peptidoglycan/xylan/chitin deacetylase (PgdA/CDA1 family)